MVSLTAPTASAPLGAATGETTLLRANSLT